MPNRPHDLQVSYVRLDLLKLKVWRNKTLLAECRLALLTSRRVYRLALLALTWHNKQPWPIRRLVCAQVSLVHPLLTKQLLPTRLRRTRLDSLAHKLLTSLERKHLLNNRLQVNLAHLLPIRLLLLIKPQRIKRHSLAQGLRTKPLHRHLHNNRQHHNLAQQQLIRPQHRGQRSSKQPLSSVRQQPTRQP